MNRIHHTVTGNVYEVKRKGGRHPLPDHVKRNHPITARTTEAEKERFLAEQQKSGMSESAFAELMLFIGLESYLNQKTV